MGGEFGESKLTWTGCEASLQFTFHGQEPHRASHLDARRLGKRSSAV